MNGKKQHSKINKWLYPVSFLYGIGVRLRNKLFDWSILKQKTYQLPIICIGNITVGGTGKTPHTEYLLSFLSDRYHTAVLSRGYKRKTKGFILASENSNSSDIGDEPYQIQQKFPKIKVAVDANRKRGIENLLKLNTPPIDLVVLDDAYQHRYVKAGLNILLTDYSRMIYNDKLLPAGLLREPLGGKDRAHIVIVTKCPDDIKPIDFNIISKHLDLYPFQKLYFSSLKYGNLYNLIDKNLKINLSQLKRYNQILLLTGIANPLYLKEELAKHTTHLSCLSFKDHHNFTEKDINSIQAKFDALEGENKLIITTEKDAVRLINHSHLSKKLKNYIYIIPVEVQILQDKQIDLQKNILDYVKEDKRNC